MTQDRGKGFIVYVGHIVCVAPSSRAYVGVYVCMYLARRSSWHTDADRLFKCVCMHISVYVYMYVGVWGVPVFD